MNETMKDVRAILNQRSLTEADNPFADMDKEEPKKDKEEPKKDDKPKDKEAPKKDKEEPKDKPKADAKPKSDKAKEVNWSNVADYVIGTLEAAVDLLKPEDKPAFDMKELRKRITATKEDTPMKDMDDIDSMPPMGDMPSGPPMDFMEM